VRSAGANFVTSFHIDVAPPHLPCMIKQLSPSAGS